MRISDWSSDVCSSDLVSLRQPRASSSTSIASPSRTEPRSGATYEDIPNDHASPELRACDDPIRALPASHRSRHGVGPCCPTTGGPQPEPRSPPDVSRRQKTESGDLEEAELRSPKSVRIFLNHGSLTGPLSSLVDPLSFDTPPALETGEAPWRDK